MLIYRLLRHAKLFLVALLNLAALSKKKSVINFVRHIFQNSGFFFKAMQCTGYCYFLYLKKKSNFTKRNNSITAMTNCMMTILQICKCCCYCYYSYYYLDDFPTKCYCYYYCFLCLKLNFFDDPFFFFQPRENKDHEAKDLSTAGQESDSLQVRIYILSKP